MENWHPAMAFGHQLVDEAHQQLAEFADLSEAALRAGNAPALAAGLRSLLTSSGDHFAMEEQLMAETRYPEAEAHREAHAAFLIELRALLLEVERSGIGGGVRLWFDARLAAWMRYHVKGRDAALMRHVSHLRAAERARAAARAAEVASARVAALGGRAAPVR